MCGVYISDQQIELDHIDWLCTECWKRLPRTEQDIKPENLTETALTEGKSEVKHLMHLHRAAAYLFFEKDHPIQQLIHRIKYADEPELGYHLGRQAVLDWRDETFFDDIDYIIPMPLHPKRMRWPCLRS